MIKVGKMTVELVMEVGMMFKICRCFEKGANYWLRLGGSW